MKKTSRTLPLAIGMFILLIVTVIGCGDAQDNPAEPLAKQTVSIPVSVVDSSGTPIDKASLAISGTVYDAQGKAIPTVRSVGGQALFYADESTETDNIVRITASKEGYLDTGIELNASAAGEYPAEIVMIKTENEPLEGVTSGKTVFEDAVGANGTLLREVAFSIDHTRLSIAEGTLLTDADGIPAAAGDLTIRVTDFDSKTTKAFPGSLTPVANNVPTGEGESASKSVSMITAGYASIIIEDVEGNRIKKGEFTITMDLTMAENPETGKPVQAGELIAVWSYDEPSGEWSYETDGKVVDNNGSLEVTIVSNHLTVWNIAYWDGPYCYMQIEILGGLGAVTRWDFSLPEGWSKSPYDLGTGELRLFQSPADRNVTTVVSYLGNIILETTLEFADPDHDGTCTPIVVDLEDLIDDPVPTEVTFTESCPSGANLNPVPNVSLYKTTLSTYLGMTDASGKKTLMLTQDSLVDISYLLTLGYNNERYVGAINDGSDNYYMNGTFSVIGGGSATVNFTLSDSYCEPITGGSGGSTE